ncbi:MAG: hypothetical protein JWN04_2651 [Myxococcaceae bacterium]|nr:hypothetical protein [Myxococcaceae bacterium]
MTTVVPLTVPQLLEAQARTSPEGTPFRIDGHALSYGQWERRSRSLAHGLLEAGIAPGMRIALLFDGLDWFGYAVAYLGVLRCGGTAVHLNGHIPEAEIERRLIECGVSRIIHSEFLAPPAGFRRRCSPVAALMSQNDEPLSIVLSPQSVADIRYTSGTTGCAKAYMVSHANLTFGRTLDSMRQFAQAASMLVPMTLGTTTSANILTIGLTSPSVLVLCSPLDVEHMGELIERERITALMITPHIAGQIVEARLADRYDLSSIRVFASASAPLAPTLARALLACVPGSILQIACAQSEASPALLTHTFIAERPFSVGKPSAITELKVVDPAGAAVAPGQVGEIWLRTPAPKRLFLNAPDVNALLLRDGWHRTGDLGRIDEHGELEFFDRIVDALTDGDRLISSVALEAILLEHQAVREAAIVGVPRHDGGQEIVAFAVLRDPSALNAVREHVMSRVPVDHRPARILSVSALPKTQNGKVLKRELRLDAHMCAPMAS